jgi:hypothetical protein
MMPLWIAETRLGWKELPGFSRMPRGVTDVTLGILPFKGPRDGGSSIHYCIFQVCGC